MRAGPGLRPRPPLAVRRPRPWRPARRGSPLGVLYRYPLLVAVIAAGGTHVMRALQIAAPRAGLQRDRGGLVMRAAGALLPLGSPTLGDGHEVRPLSVAELVLQSGQSAPTGVHPPRAAARARRPGPAA